MPKATPDSARLLIFVGLDIKMNKLSKNQKTARLSSKTIRPKVRVSALVIKKREVIKESILELVNFLVSKNSKVVVPPRTIPINTRAERTLWPKKVRGPVKSCQSPIWAQPRGKWSYQ